MQTALLELLGSTSRIIWQGQGYIGGDRDVNGRGRGGSYYGKFVVAVAASGFGTVVMTDRILKQRQGKRRSNNKIGERTVGSKYRYNRDRDEQ